MKSKYVIEGKRKVHSGKGKERCVGTGVRDRKEDASQVEGEKGRTGV